MRLFAWPKYCSICQEPAEQGVCDACQPYLPWAEAYCFRCGTGLGCKVYLCYACTERRPHFHRLQAAFHYDTVIAKWLCAFKYQGDLAAGRRLSELWHKRIIEEEWLLPDVLIPVPLHEKKQRQRGFNQSIEMARALSKYLQRRLITKGVTRKQNTLSQASLSRENRKLNMRKAFSVEVIPSYRHVAIIDDVYTTGATVSALAAELQAAGVKRVDVWSLCLRA